MSDTKQAYVNHNSNSSQMNELVSCGQIIRLYLEQNGYDGLMEKFGECGCELDDLMPCGGDYAMECEAGYKTKCDCGDGHDFHITGRKSSKLTGG